MYRQLKNMFELAKLRDDLHEIYFNQVIETFAISLISIFIPIYLLERGFSMMTTFMFMLVYWGAMFLLTPLAAEISSKIGFKHTIIYRAPLLITFFSLLLFLEHFSGMLFFIALLGGFSAILYWLSTNAQFVKSSSDTEAAKQVGYLTALPQVSATIAPLLSALILTVLGFSTLFVAVIILIIVSQVPFLLTSDYKEIFRLKMRKSWLFLDRRFFAFFLIQGVIFSNEFLVWNIFVYQKFGILTMGLAATLFGAGMAVFTIFVGKASANAKRRKNMLIYGGLGYAFTCIIRISMQTPTEAILISLLAGIFTTIISIPIYVQFCERGRKEGVLNWVTFRDICLAGGRVIFVIAAAGVLFLEPEIYFAAGSFIAAMFSLMLLLLAK